ncbi:mannitol dehydrogenase family protein [Lentilitoribacter sp. Alg239-R112]|uniref:mannitol dehydrogenase family protein n=1 Tax=Lentilitoribacter sp. Alg239-R112 TaxID=2305987 RepID=UPI0013A6AB24|nr:mannitol dehydrogenase family protein [Lentilitoribacter sp. Alg239-R112]
MKLSNATLNRLPADIKRPHYDRSAITPGIVHIGLGNFHRAHQSWYLHRLMQTGDAFDWGIVGAGVRAADQHQCERLAKQDYLTTLIELDPKGRSAEIVGSMVDFVAVEENNSSLIAQLAKPEIRIVSLTVTEGGYYLDSVTRAFDNQHPDIKFDAENPDNPRTAFGAIIAALKLRKAAGSKPFTCQSCDNLQGNGDILKNTILSLANLSDKALANWIEQNCSFPNSMVDCIVPATGEKELDLAKDMGIEDDAPVTHENFRQWVIEDKFCNDRPNWENVGVTITDDVHSYESMKIRILNGGHQLIANAGEMLSIEFISDCMEHNLIGNYFRKVAVDEIAPNVESVPNMTPADYVRLIDQRFSNPEIIDTVRRVAFDGSSRQTGFILPTLRQALQVHSACEGLILSQAIWARMCEGTREDGSLIMDNDPNWDDLKASAKRAKETPIIWLQQRHIYGDLINNEYFVDRFVYWYSLISSYGTAAALRAYLGH